MTKRIIVVLDDRDFSSTEHYMELLTEELQSILSTRFQIVSVNEEGEICKDKDSTKQDM